MRKVLTLLGLMCSSFLWGNTVNVTTVEELQTALDNTANTVINIMNDLTITTRIAEYDGGKAYHGIFVRNRKGGESVTINGNGYTIKGGDDLGSPATSGGASILFNITGASFVTLKNMTIDGNEKFNYVVQAYASSTSAKTNLALEKVTIKGSVVSKKYWVVTVYSGYELHVNGATVTMKDTTITKNATAAVYIDNGDYSMTAYVYVLGGCSVGTISKASDTSAAVDYSNATGYNAYSVVAKTTAGAAALETVVSDKSWNELLTEAQAVAGVTIVSAAVTLKNSMDLPGGSFSSENANLSIDGAGYTVVGTFTVTSTPSALTNMVFGSGSVIDLRETTVATCGITNSTVAQGVTIKLPNGTTPEDDGTITLPVTIPSGVTALVEIDGEQYEIGSDYKLPVSNDVIQNPDTGVSYETIADLVADAEVGDTVEILMPESLSEEDKSFLRVPTKTGEMTGDEALKIVTLLGGSFKVTAPPVIVADVAETENVVYSTSTTNEPLETETSTDPNTTIEETESESSTVEPLESEVEVLDEPILESATTDDGVENYLSYNYALGFSSITVEDTIDADGNTIENCVVVTVKLTEDGVPVTREFPADTQQRWVVLKVTTSNDELYAKTIAIALEGFVDGEVRMAVAPLSEFMGGTLNSETFRFNLSIADEKPTVTE